MDTPSSGDTQLSPASLATHKAQLSLFAMDALDDPQDVMLADPGTVAQMEVAYEVLDAPLAHLASRDLPRTLKKANAAVHVHATQGKYSLTMRRLFNALLALSFSKLSQMPSDTVQRVVANQQVIRFEAWGVDIKKLIGGESNKDYASLYEMLSALTVMPVVWDVMSNEGDTWEKHTTLLSQWERSKESGKIAWAWMPDLFGLLFDPENPFTPLDLALTRKFNSKYTLALYENCFRYRKIKQTAWRSTREWVLLIAGPDRYKDYREFKRTVLKTALQELGSTPDCTIIVELEERRGRYNRVDELRFLVTPKPQLPLEMSLPADVSPAFLNQLRKLGLADAKINQLLRDFDVTYLQAQLQYTYRVMARRTLASPAGFFIRAVEDRYEEELAKAEATTKQVIQQLETACAPDPSHALAQAWFEQQSDALKSMLLTRHEAQASFTIQRSLARVGITHKSVAPVWRKWLSTQPEFLQAN